MRPEGTPHWASHHPGQPGKSPNKSHLHLPNPDNRVLNLHQFLGSQRVTELRQTLHVKCAIFSEQHPFWKKRARSLGWPLTHSGRTSAAALESEGL